MKIIDVTFRAHQPRIGAFAQRGPDAFARGYRFVLATIQQPLWFASRIVAPSFEREGAASPYAARYAELCRACIVRLSACESQTRRYHGTEVEGFTQVRKGLTLCA